jgi:hypothetical protein
MQNDKSNKNQVENLITNGYELDFGIVFEAAIDNYKKIVLYAGLIFLIFSIVMIILFVGSAIAYLGVENVENVASRIVEFQKLKQKPLEILVPVYATSLLFSGLISPFLAGFFRMAHCGHKGEEFNVSSMFCFYKSPYSLNIFLTTILIGFINNTAVILADYAGLSFVGTVFNLVISFLTFLTIPLIVFGSMNVNEALRTSIYITMKQPLVLVGLLFLAGIIAVVGIFGLYIGIFFSVPFLYSMEYTIYKSIFGIEQKDVLSKIGTDNC